MPHLAHLDAVAERLGSGLIASSSVGWGDAGATSRLELADGRTVAVRRMAGPDAPGDARRVALVMARLAESGIPVPPPTVVEDPGPAAWLITPWVEGDTGAAWLDRPDRARHLAQRMGELAAQLQAVDVTAMGLAMDAATDRDLAALARRRLGAVPMDPATRRAVDAHLELLTAEGHRQPVFVHGDFAPINVIVDAAGKVGALLDLEHAAIGPPGVDAAWWGWVVRHHHPEAWAAAWQTFCRAATIDASREAARLRALVLCQLLGRAASQPDPSLRARWLERLAGAAADSGGDRQPT